METLPGLPGHTWTNGFVERPQGTQAFLRFYNEQRPRQGFPLWDEV